MGLSIKKGDSVMVNSGSDKGTVGKVLACFPRKQKALVEGVNVVWKHAKAQSQQKPGGRSRKEMPIHTSKLTLIDPKTNEPTRFSNVTLPDGRKIRRSKKGGNEL